MNNYTATVIEDENGDLILPFPEELLEELGWKIGDKLLWKDNENGTFTIQKDTPMINKQIVDEIKNKLDQIMVQQEYQLDRGYISARKDNIEKLLLEIQQEIVHSLIKNNESSYR